MKRYIVKQPKHSEINDEKAFKIGRADINACFRSNNDGDYKVSGYINACFRSNNDGDYRVSGYITADDLNEVFRIGNTEPDQIEKVDKFYSISCGDIIVDPDTQVCHLVSPLGFTRIGYDAHFGKGA